VRYFSVSGWHPRACPFFLCSSAKLSQTSSWCSWCEIDERFSGLERCFLFWLLWGFFFMCVGILNGWVLGDDDDDMERVVKYVGRFFC
jgi:hypothetical protein